MTFKDFMAENGYEVITTFWEDFSLADRFGILAINDTYDRTFTKWKDNCKYLTELILVLNHKIAQYYEVKPHIAELYDTLWRKADQYARENLKGDDANYYFHTTD